MFDAAAMREQLPARWPGSKVFPGPAFEGDTAVLSANVATAPQSIAVHVDPSRQFIGMEPDSPKEAGEFFAWELEFLDAEPERITLYGKDFATEHTITRAASAREITELLGG